MAERGKQVQKSQIINFAGKMDSLQNSEVVNLNPNENGIAFEYLENADLYYTKALKTRKGTEDIGCGIVNITMGSNNIVNTSSGLSVSGTTAGATTLFEFSGNTSFSYRGMIFVPSGNNVLKTLTLNVQNAEDASAYANLVAAGEQNLPVSIQAQLFMLNATPYPVSGLGAFSGTSGGVNNILHNIGFAGPFNAPPNPKTVDATTSALSDTSSSTFPLGAVPVAVGEVLVDFGSLIWDGSYFSSTRQDVDIKFAAPVVISSGIAYAFRFGNQVFGTLPRSTDMQTFTNTATDLGVNVRNARDTNIQAINQYNWIPNGSNKTVPNVILTTQESVSFLYPEHATADNSIPLPIKEGFDGTNISPYVYPGTIYNSGTYVSGPAVQAFENISGSHIWYGSYFHIGPNVIPNNRPNFQVYVAYNSDGTLLTGTKTVGVYSNLYSVDVVTGSIAGGDYIVTAKTLLASGTSIAELDYDLPAISNQGTNQSGGLDIYIKPSFRLQKVYTIFDDAATITASGNYLLEQGLYDYNTGEDYADYVSGAGYFQSATRFAVDWINTPASGAYMVNDYFGNNTTNMCQQFYNNPLNDFTSKNFNMTAGLIDIPSGNAIVGLYDYRIGVARSSKIVYGQGGEIRYFDLDTPCKDTHTTIYSGISQNTNALMTFETYDDLLFMHDYSQISGVCWNQTNSGTMIHGLRPTAKITTVSGTVGGAIVSGTTYSLMVGNEYSSGGIRTTVFENLIASGVSISGNFIQVSGLANQFAFDVPASQMYVYITAASGANYYLASAYSGTSTFSAQFDYPLASGTDVIYIPRLANINTDISFSETHDLPINYALSQVDTPKYKQVKVFSDYLLGIGDPIFPSRLWYSEQYAPQIWGESFDYHGFAEIDKDNGQSLTGMARLRDFMMIFKSNSTYRCEFLGDTSAPFSITQISSKVGALGPFGLVSVGDTVYGISEYGIFQTNGATVEVISDPISLFLGDMDHADLAFAVAVHDMHEDKIIWSITNDNLSPDKNFGIMFNYKEGSFSIRKNGMWNAAATVYDDDNFDVLLGGDTLGQIHKLEVADVDTSILFADGAGSSSLKAISLTAETPWMSVLDSQIVKQLKFIDFNIEKTDAQLRIDVYFNENSVDKRYSRYIDLNTSNADKRVHLGGSAKTVKFVFTQVGNPALIKIKSMNLYFTPLGNYNPM